MASKRAAAAISSSAADGDGDEEAAAPAGPGEEGGKKPRTLLEAAKELKKATANMDAGTIKQMRAKEEEHRMLKEANQVGKAGGGGRGGGVLVHVLVTLLLVVGWMLSYIPPSRCFQVFSLREERGSCVRLLKAGAYGRAGRPFADFSIQQ